MLSKKIFISLIGFNCWTVRDGHVNMKVEKVVNFIEIIVGMVQALLQGQGARNSFGEFLTF